MTTPQPTALPELPEPGYVHEDGHDEYGYATYGRAYTADQMRARDAMWAERIAALQSAQPAAAVSDESAYNLIDRFLRNNLHDDDYAEYSQALDILALRPQAVPMTDEQIRSMCKQEWVFETVKQWVSVIEAHHGITAQGAQGEQA